jgi:seryl-tRNA synthetase
MIDPKTVLQNLEAYKLAAKHKRIAIDWNNFATLFESRSQAIQALETLNQQRNAATKEIPTLQGEAQETKKAWVRELSKERTIQEELLKTIEDSFKSILYKIPSIPSTDTPVGETDADNVPIYTVGTIPTMEKTPKSHIELGLENQWLSFEKGIQISGSRSFVLLGDMALLERAIHNLTIDILMQSGFELVSVPVLVKPSAMEGTGYLPGGADQAYYIEKDDMWLVGTAEVPLAAMLQNMVIDPADLPMKLCAYSYCFRREAGAHGKDTKGLYRVHQFQKIEQVVVCDASIEKSDVLHAEILANSERVMQLLEIPYRVVQVCTGDLGQGQVKKHDIEAWMPSRQNFGETHSCSSFYEFQARRLNIKTTDHNKKNIYCYTLNNTAAATPRLLIPFLENHQLPDGRIRIPAALQPYMQNKTHMYAKI